jgi:hypothetical protein
MVTITRREGHWGAILSRDGRWLAAEKMIERGQWFVLQGERQRGQRGEARTRSSDTCWTEDGRIRASLFRPHAHVLGHVWAERLVETDADQAIRMTSEIDDLPFLPVLAPQSDAPSSSGPGFRAVLIPKRRHPGLGHLGRDGRRVFVRTTEPAGSLEREERTTEIGPASLDGGVRGRHEGGAVHGVLSGCGRHRGEDRSAEKERAIGVARHGCKRYRVREGYAE